MGAIKLLRSIHWRLRRTGTCRPQIDTSPERGEGPAAEPYRRQEREDAWEREGLGTAVLVYCLDDSELGHLHAHAFHAVTQHPCHLLEGAHAANLGKA